MQTNGTEVDIFDFTSYRPYLDEVLRKRSRMSLRGIARKAGLPSSATLTQILNDQRKLTPEVAGKLSGYLGLKGKQKDYLSKMAELSVVRVPAKKRVIEEQLIQLRSHKLVKTIELAQYRFLSHWYYVAIYLLTQLPDFQDDTTWIAKRLGGLIRPSEVQEAIDDMIQLSLLKRLADGSLERQSYNSMGTAEDIKLLALQKFHQEMIDLALKRLETPVEEREFTGVMREVPMSCLPEVKERIRQFRLEMDDFLAKQQNKDEIYYLNIQFFPVSRPVDSNLIKGGRSNE